MINLATIKLIASGLVLAAAFSTGWKVCSWRSDLIIAGMNASVQEAARQSAADARRIEQLQRDASDAVAQADLLRNQERETIERIVINDVIKYVQTDNASVCGLDAAGVRIHDTAASGRVPGVPQTTSPPDGSPGRSSNAEVIQVVAQNYNTCRATSNRLTALQEWIRAVQSASSGLKTAGEKNAGPSLGG